MNRYVKRQETIAAATTASVAPVFEQSLHKAKIRDGNGQQPKVQPMRFTSVRQTVLEASSSSMTSTKQGEQQQPRVSAGAPSIFKDSRHEQKDKTNKGKKLCYLHS